MKNKFLIVLLIFVSVYIFAQNQPGIKLIESGLNNFSNGNYTLALGDFREIILESEYQNIHGTAYYWIARSYMAQNLLVKAENNLDFFIKNYKDHHLFPDAMYQKGRLLFKKGQYDNAVQIFYQFINTYPEHPYISNSYYWISESLFELGHLEKAKIIYEMIIREYPNSFKLEASKYKLSLISLKFRENELLKLLRISHEEYLKALEDFQRREKTYEQTISDFQRKLLSSSSEDEKLFLEEITRAGIDKDNTIASLNRKIIELNDTIAYLKEQINSKNLVDNEEVVAAVDIDTDSLKTIRLLDLKESALELKEFYINWLASRIGE